MEAILISIATASLISLLNWLFTRPAKHTQEIHQLDVRLTTLEQKLNHTDSQVQKTEDAVEEIKENMVRKSDLTYGLDVINKRIDELISLLTQR